MGSVVAVRREPSGEGVAERMLSATPHRGAAGPVARVGPWELGVGGAESYLAVEGERGLALTGRLDADPWWTGRVRAAGGNPAAALLALTQEEGREALGRLRGVFSMVAVERDGLWGARDHLGFSPLFFGERGDRIAVATQARQVVAGLDRVPEPALDVVEGVFWGSYDDDTGSFLQGARRVPKASLVTFDAGSGFRSRRYWNPADLLETRRSGWTDLAEEFHGHMRRAVARAMYGGTAVALSGGVDSPAVAAYAAEEALDRGELLPIALSAVYPDLPSVDESAYIEGVAARHGMDLRTYRPRAKLFDDLEEYVRLADGPAPTVSLVESAELYRLARSQGIETILTGEMAEFVIAMGANTLAHLIGHGRLRGLAAYLSAERRRGLPATVIARRAVRAILPPDAVHLPRPGSVAAPVPWLDADRFRAKGGVSPPFRRRWEAQQVSAFVGPGISLEADEAVQAACGVRVRRPWLDVDLWEFFLALPAEVRYPDGRYKGLMKRWLRGRVPDEILDRRDRTYFDESFWQRFDRARLKSLLVDVDYRMPGVDYGLLLERLNSADLDLREGMWAKDLAVVHAFMKAWA